jgi:hypothetical protein
MEAQKEWAELGSLEDLCPSNALARPTKVEAQKGCADQGSLEDSCPFDALAPLPRLRRHQAMVAVW